MLLTESVPKSIPITEATPLTMLPGTTCSVPRPDVWLLAVPRRLDVLHDEEVGRVRRRAVGESALVERSPRVVAVVTADTNDDPARVPPRLARGDVAVVRGCQIGRRLHVRHPEGVLPDRRVEDAHGELHLQRRVVGIRGMLVVQPAPTRVADLRAAGPDAALEVAHEPGAAAEAVAPERRSEEQRVHRDVCLWIR